MKWRFETWQEERERLTHWHRWFAWWPTVLTGTNEKVWLQRIYRKGTLESGGMDTWWAWEYAEDIFEVLKT